MPSRSPTKTAPVNQPSALDTAVGAADLARLDVLHGLLFALNDSLAGAGKIARHAARMPALEARIGRCFANRFPTRALPPLSEQIAALGNRDLEAVVLELLEDLTVLRADLDPVARPTTDHDASSPVGSTRSPTPQKRPVR